MKNQPGVRNSIHQKCLLVEGHSKDVIRNDRSRSVSEHTEDVSKFRSIGEFAGGDTAIYHWVERDNRVDKHSVFLESFGFACFRQIVTVILFQFVFVFQIFGFSISLEKRVLSKT